MGRVKLLHSILVLLFFIILSPTLLVHGMTTAPSGTVSGTVFLDLNSNGIRDSGEPGIPNVAVSNGREVVLTDVLGRYSLPAFANMTVFVIPPDGYFPPLNNFNQPQFYYHYYPQGSPRNIRHGLPPTGPLPKEINFPLRRIKGFTHRFTVAIIGDTQIYEPREAGYLRDTAVREIAGTNATFAILLGDNVGGGNVELYPELIRVLSGMGIPFFMVPGNHDMNHEADNNTHAFDAYKNFTGPTYYAFQYGKVHFIVLNSVYYLGGNNRANYRGEIEERQLEWLRNYLKFVPPHHLIVLNMHIPPVSFQDRLSDKHQVRNRQALYEILKGRKVLILSGHTHTLEQFLPGEQVEGWGHPTPFHQVLVGAAAGSWWTGDFDADGVPFSFQRCGAPRGYLLIHFDNINYRIEFRPTNMSPQRQMSLSFLTQSFQNWYEELRNWLERAQGNPLTQDNPPKNINDLPDQGKLNLSEVRRGINLVINVWNGRRDTEVNCIFNSEQNIRATRDMNLIDPYALRHQLSVLRWSVGFNAFGRTFGPLSPRPLPLWLLTTQSPHIWKCEVPKNLLPGVHKVEVKAVIDGVPYREIKIFEVIEDDLIS